MSKEVIIVREGVVQSLIKDAGTFLMAVALVGIGVLLASTAMQWIGAFVFFTSVIALHQRDNLTMTVPEARKRLDEIEGVAA